MPDNLKLIALDAEDLAVLSAHMQDAVLLIGDMTYLPRERRFAAIANRFDWQEAAQIEAGGGNAADYKRHRAALRFERVLAAQLSGIDLKDTRRALNILALLFEPTSEPGGHVTIICAGNAAVRLHVECLEAELKDLGAVWSAKTKPTHAASDPENSKKPE